MLKTFNRLDEALAAYDAIIEEHPEDIVARSGRAEVLKKLNRLDEALAAYDAVIEAHPESVFAKNGRAEVLKALNRLDEALAAYDAIIEKHPEDIVAKSGRAEVLKTLNRLDEALAAYDAIIEKHPEDIVAKNGRAEVLKALNRLDEALAAYDAIIEKHPENIVAKNGRACILVAIGSWNQALAMLPSQQPITEQEWIGYHIRGVALLRLGQIEDAIKLFEEGIKYNPRPAHKDYFRTALALARIKKLDYSDARNLIADIDARSLEVSANVIRLHVYGRLGDIELADAAYKAIPANSPIVCQELLGELQSRYLRKEAPKYSDEWIIESEIECLLMAA